MKKSTRENLLLEIDSFLRRTGISKTRLGLESVGNDRIVDQIRAGKNPRIDTVDDLRTYMQDKLTELKARPKSRACQPAY